MKSLPYADMADVHQYPPTAVAIVGMAGRFPDAPDLRAFWRNLADGVESLEPVSDAELLKAGVPPEQIADPNYVKKCTYLEGADRFDAAFFGFNAREAEILDPQHRVFLECAWEAVEDAGYIGDRYPGSVAVFAGASLNTYLLANLIANPAVLEAVGPYQMMVSNDKDFLATRVNYKLDLRGPGLTVQTACSTSLVAVQMAWQSLLNRECDLALAGGVSVSFPQKIGYLYRDGLIFSPDGHCRPFDEKGQGIRVGSGAGVVALKRIHDAIRDGDAIRAVILGAAINNDGAEKMGYTAPGINGQAEVIVAAQERAGVDPDTITYIEAHGTATPLGDPVEVSALTQAFRARTSRKGFCGIGSVKSNIGHLDTAAGIAGVIKTVLSLEHKQLAPSLNFERPNPQIDFANSPFYVNHTLSNWEPAGHPRRAGVSSFGIGGTNAHAVLEEAPARPRSVVKRSKQLLVLSARTPTALDTATENLAAYLESNPDVDLADVAYTLQVGRKRFEYRRAVVCKNVGDAVSALRRAIARGEQRASAGSVPPIAFLFSGQGSQYAGMAKSLYETDPTFREALDECATLLHPQLERDIRALILTSISGDIEPELNQTRFAQPALFAIEYALARMLMAWGIQPSAMLGHSIGEYVAACVSGVLSLSDGLRLVAERGRLMQKMPAGRMVAVPLSETEVTTLLESQLDAQLTVAAVNAPRLCVVAGPTASVAEFEQKYQAQGIECRPLHTSHAFHSAMMDPVLTPFRAVVETVTLGAPAIPYVSNLTGTWITASQVVRPDYWSRHLRATVRFADGVRELMQLQGALLIEVGPGKTLSMLARQTIGSAGNEVLNVLPHPLDEQSDLDVLYNALGRLWIAGADIAWDQVHRGERLQRVSLPTYPFERQRYVVEPQRSAAVDPSAPLPKKPNIADWFYVPSWKRVPSACDSARTLPPADGTAWLIFADECGVGDRIAKRVEGAGYRCLTVRAGNAYIADGDHYTIRVNERQDYDRVIADVVKRGIQPRRVVHLWSVTSDESDISTDQALNAGFFSVIQAAQAFGDSGRPEPISLTVVSTGIQQVIGTEPISPLKSLVLGPSQVVGHEMSTVRCQSVDIILSEVTDELIDQLILETFNDPSNERGRVVASAPVAYRGGYRWVETFETMPVEARETRPARLRERGTYLITGGLGGIGMAVANFLAETVKARLVLVGRSGLPERTEWPSWLSSHPENDITSTRIRSVQSLEALGAQVLIASADVSDRVAMDDVVARAQEQFGPIHGVFHTAGLPGGMMLAVHARKRSREVLAAKVDGTLVLDAIFGDSGLDFLVLFSSMNAMLSFPATTDYTAANRFLDSFATARRSAKFPVIAIDWDTWGDVGMAAVAAEAWGTTRAEMFHAITTEEGIEALRRALSLSVPHVSIVTRNLCELLDRYRVVQHDEEVGAAGTGKSSARQLSQHARPDLEQAFAEPQNDRERFIAGVWEELLGLERIGVNDNFFELGGHSLIAAGMLSRLQYEYNVKLPLRTIFDVPTIRQLSEHISTLSWATQSASAPASVASDSGTEGNAADDGREEFEI